MQTHRYEPASAGWPTKFLTSQADNLCLALRPSNSLATQFVLKEAALYNKSGGNAYVGIGGRIPISLWSFGRWDDSLEAAGIPYIDDTTDAQDAGTGDVALDTVGTNNDGFVVGCDIPFNVVSLQVSQASVNGTTWDVAYSAAAGWTTLTAMYVLPDFTATGERLVWFEPPTDWIKVTAASAIAGVHGAGVPRQYGLRVRATGDPDTDAGLASLVTLGRVFYTSRVGTESALYAAENELYLPPQCDAIAACFSTGSQANRAEVRYRMA